MKTTTAIVPPASVFVPSKLQGQPISPTASFRKPGDIVPPTPVYAQNAPKNASGVPAIRKDIVPPGSFFSQPLGQAIVLPDTVETRGVDLNTVEAVLVKMYFTNREHVPAGIPTVYVCDKRIKQNDRHHALVAIDAGHAELATIGRVRAGRVDTGVQTVKNLSLVHLGLIRRGLTNVSFQLREISSYRDDRKEKFVVVLAFVKGDLYEEAHATTEEREAHKLLHSSAVVQAIRDLANKTWGHCHVWDNNLTHKTATINVTDLSNQSKAPKHTIAVRAGKIVDVPVVKTLDEGEE